MSRNVEIAEILESFADFLDAQDVEYKPRSYRRAAENVRDYPVAIEELAAEGHDTVQRIEGVGDAIADKIIEYVETGSIEEYDALRADLPVQMDELTAVEGVGPKSVGALYHALEITTLAELEAAAETGEIRAVSGFGEKTESNILENIPFAKQAQRRELLGHGRPVADELLTSLRTADEVDRCSVAGSIRRWKPTIGDIDVLVGTDEPESVVKTFTSWERIESVIESGTTKASARARGIRIDVRLVEPDEFGAALQYFTGSRDHNVGLRNRAIDRGYRMNEYGVFDVNDVDDEHDDTRAGIRIAGETEESMYTVLDLPWIPPELREDAGEIDAAAENVLPDLVAVDAISGDLHTHTEWSDGTLSITELVAAADSFGHDYLAICDHATGPGMVGGVGLSDDELRAQRSEIESVREDSDIAVFAGVEANIDADGEISVGDDVLSELECVVASPHSDLDQERKPATDRLVRAVEHEAVDILGHPSGRLLNSRPGLDFDIDKVASAAAGSETALEVNANPQRLDLDGPYVRAAIEAGASVVINTDAHSAGEFSNVRYGVHTARRGWAEASQVINTWSTEDLRAFLG